MAIKNELMISEAEMTALIQLTNTMIGLILLGTYKAIMAGITDNTIKGKLIKNQNLDLDKTALVFSQKNPLKVKLISPFLFMVTICIYS